MIAHFGVAVLYPSTAPGPETGLFSGSTPSLCTWAVCAAGQGLQWVAPLCLGRASSGPVPQVPDVPWPGVALANMWPWPLQLWP